MIRKFFPCYHQLPIAAVLAVALLTGAGHSQTTNPQGQIQLDQTQDQSQLLAAAAPACTQSADFCMRPSFILPLTDPFRGKCSAVNAPQTLKLVAFCFDPFTGAAIPGVTIQSITAEADPTSGFHLHGASTSNARPAGQANPSSGPVGADNTLHFTYTAPDLSGLVTLTNQATLPDGTPCIPGTATIAIETSGLSAIPASGPGYTTTTSVGHDGNNLAANPSAAVNLQQMPPLFDEIAIELEEQFLIPTEPIPTVTYTSISLPFGGLFDVDDTGLGTITHEWHPPHCAHRRGLEADLRIKNIPMEFRGALYWSIIMQGFTMTVAGENPSVPTATHWHMTSH